MGFERAWLVSQSHFQTTEKQQQGSRHSAHFTFALWERKPRSGDFSRPNPGANPRTTVSTPPDITQQKRRSSKHKKSVWFFRNKTKGPRWSPGKPHTSKTDTPAGIALHDTASHSFRQNPHKRPKKRQLPPPLCGGRLVSAFGNGELRWERQRRCRWTLCGAWGSGSDGTPAKAFSISSHRGCLRTGFGVEDA